MDQTGFDILPPSTNPPPCLQEHAFVFTSIPLFRSLGVSIYAHTFPCIRAQARLRKPNQMCLFGSAYAPKTKYARLYLE